jgi:hypothetical protein
MAAPMEKTRHAGIYKRGGRYVVVWWHKGRQHKAAYKTLAEAREAKGQRDSGERQASSRADFEEYAREWLESYGGRTTRGVGARTCDSPTARPPRSPARNACPTGWRTTPSRPVTRRTRQGPIGRSK